MFEKVTIEKELDPAIKGGKVISLMEVDTFISF